MFDLRSNDEDSGVGESAEVGRRDLGVTLGNSAKPDESKLVSAAWIILPLLVTALVAMSGG